MRILILTTDYPQFLTELYRDPGLASSSFAEQMRVRDKQLFNVASFYAAHLRDLGHETSVVYANNLWMLAAWAREHGISAPEVIADVPDSELIARAKRLLRPYKRLVAPLARRVGIMPTLSSVERAVIRAQVDEFGPDIILNQDLQMIDSDFVKSLRSPGRCIIAQIGVDPPPDLDVKAYTFGLSQIPWVVAHFERMGLPARQHHLGFEPTILDRLPAVEKDVDVSFVGAVTAAHGARVKFLEEIARSCALEIWVPDLKGIPASSPLHSCRRGQVFGMKMFSTLQRSKITLNSHIDVARGSATNMRLFEATGVGAFLLTDNLRDLSTLFEPDVEVGVYNSTADCIEKIGRYLSDSKSRTTIAAAGQKRTLTKHTYRQRAEELMNLIVEMGSIGCR